MLYIIDNNNVLWLLLFNFGLIGLDVDIYEYIYMIDLEKNKLGILFYDMVFDEVGMIWMSSYIGLWWLNLENLYF